MELLQRLCAAWGPPGREEGVADVISDLAAPLADAVRRDPLGNLIIARRATRAGGRRLLLLAHMDGPGAIVTAVGERGQLRFAPVGGFHLWAARGQRVRFQSGLAGVLDGDRPDELKDLKLESSWVDIGARGRDDALARVAEGDMFVVDGALAELGGRVTGPNLDNRAGCAVLIRLLQELGDDLPHDLNLAFTVQGHAGRVPRGARTAAFQADADLAVAVKVTCADAGRGPAVKLGAGPVLRLKDGQQVLRPAARGALAAAADRAGVRWQPEVLEHGAAETAAVEQSQVGIPAALVGIPGRYLGTPVEMADPGDLEAAVRWLASLVQGPLDDLPR